MSVLIAKVILAQVFLYSAYGSIKSYDLVFNFVKSKGLPFAKVSFPLGIALEMLCSLGIVFDFYPRICALVLSAFLVVCAFLFHNFWAMDEPERTQETYIFSMTLGLAGGLLLIVFQ